LVEQQTVNLRVDGSSPSTVATFRELAPMMQDETTYTAAQYLRFCLQRNVHDTAEYARAIADVNVLANEIKVLRAQLAEIDAELSATKPEERIPLLRTLRLTADAARGFLRNVVIR